MAHPLRKRIDALEVRISGMASTRLVLVGGTQTDDEIRAFIRSRGFPGDAEYVLFRTVYEDRDGGVAADQRSLELVTT